MYHCINVIIFSSVKHKKKGESNILDDTMKTINLAIVGATGQVGRTFLKVLEDRKFPFDKLYCFSSKKSAGTTVSCCSKDYIVEELTETSFDDKQIDIALFSAGGEVSKKFAPIAVKHGITVVDNSSTFRMDDDVPLVVPEVNPQDIKKHKGIVANPNCSTIQAVVALKPIYDKYGISRIIYSTYQAVSGSGVKGINDLTEGLKGNELYSAYPHSIAKNCIPHIDIFLENDYTKEEMKMINETKKIFHDDRLNITATCVRVPIVNGHSEAITVDLTSSYEIEDVKELLKNANGIIMQDDVQHNIYPLAHDISGTDEVYVGRIRRDTSSEHGLNFWCVADNIRKGAATNTIQIAELMITNDWIKIIK